EDLARAGLLGVEDLPAEREDGLRVPVTPLLGAAAGGVALDDEQLALRGVRARAVRQLAGEVAPGADGALALDLRDGGAAGLPRLRRHDDPRDDGLGDRRVPVEVVLELDAEGGADERAHLRVVQLLLRLPLELGVGVVEVDDGDEPLADVVGGDLELALADLVGLDVVADRPRHAVAEALLVGAPIARGDPVDERDHALLRRLRPQEGHLHAGAVLELLLPHDEGLGVDAPRPDLGDEVVEVLDDAALVVELGAFAGGLVPEDDPEGAVEVRLDLEVLLDEGGVELGRLEDGGVRAEGDGGAGAADARPHLLQLRRGDAARVALLVERPVALDLRDELLRERVDDGGAHAVEAAGGEVVRAVELAAGVERRHDHLQRRHLLDGVLVDGDAAAVVGDGDRPAVLVEGDLDERGEPVGRLVDGVVDDLPDEVVEAGLPGASDVHARALADGLEPFEDLD